MNNLLRELAPISSAAWGEIDAEARRTLKLTLAARKLVDFVGPLGPEAAAVNLGRAGSAKEGPRAGVESRVRRVQPLVEMRVPFELSREELETVGRGAKDVDLTPVIAAAPPIICRRLIIRSFMIPRFSGTPVLMLVWVHAERGATPRSRQW